MTLSPDWILDWIDARPELASMRVAVCDLNGTFRGKRVPVEEVSELAAHGTRMPATLAAQDIWGRDVSKNPRLMEGDADALCRPTGRGPVALTWLDRPSALIPVWFFDSDGKPYLVDPRQALARVVARAEAMGLKAVVGTELEFHLISAAGLPPDPPLSPVTGRKLMVEGIHSLDEIDGFEGFFADLEDAANAADIRAESAVSEMGPGQFEISLRHQSDAMRAADDAVILKRLVRGVARKHGVAASFMAKPYQEHSGNGFHIHMSLVDAEGSNLFDDGGPRGTPLLRQAIAGCLETLVPMTLVFAPHLNSFRRLTPGAHAPVSVAWAYENRFAAIRVPGGSPKARRFEHRVAGADANPYLVIAAVLGGALKGIEEGLTPPEPTPGMSAVEEGETIPFTWAHAIDAFPRDGGGIFPAELAGVFADMKEQEMDRFAERMSDFEVQTYLETV